MFILYLIFNLIWGCQVWTELLDLFVLFPNMALFYKIYVTLLIRKLETSAQIYLKEQAVIPKYNTILKWILCFSNAQTIISCQIVKIYNKNKSV